MTRTATRKRKPGFARSASPQRTNDKAVYIAAVLIGTFIVFLVSLLTEGEWWREALVAYVALLLVLINVYAWQAYRGRSLVRWQQALARVPLRPAGYGRPRTRPLEAAHEQDDARRAILLSAVTSCAAIVVAALWLLW